MEKEGGASSSTVSVSSTKEDAAILTQQSHVYLTWAIAASAALMFGYETGITGGLTIMTPFLDKVFPFAFCVGAFLVPLFIRDRGDQKYYMVISGMLLQVGVVIRAAANNSLTHCVAQSLLGFGVGLANHSCTLYLSGLLPHRHHGWVNNCFQWMITVGILLANFFNYYTNNVKGEGRILSLALTILTAYIITIGSLLIKKFDLGAPHEDQNVKHPWKDIMMERKYRPHLLITIFFSFFQQMTGINFIMFFAPVLFKTLGADNDTLLNSTIIIGLVYACTTFIRIRLANVFERESSHLVRGGCEMFITQVVLGTVILVKFGKDDEIATNYSCVYGLISIFVFFFVLSWGPVGWSSLTETLFPHEIRSAAQSLNVSLNMLFTSIIAQVSINMSYHLKFGLFFFFASFTIVGTIFVYHFVPRVKEKSTEEMSRVWKQHWFWGKNFPDHEEVIGGGTGGGGNVQMETETTEIHEEEWVVMNKED